MGRDDILAVLREFKKNFADKYGIVELGVFGSVARDEARDDSDLDICIKTKTPDAYAMVHIKEEIESRVHKHVDIVRVREKMNPYLKDRIEKDGVYV